MLNINEFGEFRERKDDGEYISKQITVTITLEEYRELIRENERLLCENTRLIVMLDNMGSGND